MALTNNKLPCFSLEISFFVFADGKLLSDQTRCSTYSSRALLQTPIRKLLIMSLDRAKRGRGPVVVQTVSVTVCVVLVASVYSMMKIQKRWIEEGAMNLTDEVIVAKHLLESTLMGKLNDFLREFEIRFKERLRNLVNFLKSLKFQALVKKLRVIWKGLLMDVLSINPDELER
ncbi:unnamed protein product [Eruca vesicaria subsp. sativa]|uniref:Endoplasmic reticulum transmembrane protein n=1 Tax=Eruca vesicaria subsp. sativa TaxID=29727 RepID=A0ABC8IYN4_ERUVS|nr:unnamed protein product [Eruca vesicaria subsp. sativa]